MKVLAIDPGTTQSGVVIWDGATVSLAEKMKNSDIEGELKLMPWRVDACVIERFACYGMSVGDEVIQSILWSGKFWALFRGPVFFIRRMDVKMHLCKNPTAGDGNIIQALVDRFAYGARNYGKGTKKEPGFFYGFAADIWQAFALAVTWMDQKCPHFKNQ